MGQRMPPVPHIYGDDCLRGWDAGETPKYLYVRFSQIIKCPDIPPGHFETPPNDRVFKLTQDDFFTCLWEYFSVGWHVIFDLQFDPPNADIWLEHLPDGRVYFYDITATPVDEGRVYNNINRDCLLGRPSYGGIATVTWTQEATNLLEAINLERADDLFMELHPLVDGNKVYKFCKLKDGTNIQIEFEPD